MDILMKGLEGKKTYIIGILTIFLGIVSEDTQLIMIGLTSMGLRHGIKTSK